MLARGAKTGDKVAFYMRNRPEYIETLAACFKARLTHVNVNYRYTPDEVLYIFDNSDATVIVYGSEFRGVIAELQARLTKVQAVRRGHRRRAAPISPSRFDALADDGRRRAARDHPLAATTCSSSTPAAPPACPRA